MNIIDLPAGACVPGPGLYRTPLEHYHSQAICPGPSVSSSGLRTLALQSAHAFWKTSDMNPNRYPKKEDNDSLVLGKAAHALILGDEVFDEKFIFVPDDAPKRPTKTQIAAFERTGVWSEAASEGAEFWAIFDKKAEGRLLITEAQIEKIKYMSENLAASPEAVEVLTSTHVEISLIWQDEQTGIWIKSRPDCLPTNNYDFGDLKTFASKSRNLVLGAQRSTTDFGYPMQMALAVIGAEQVLGRSAENCALIFVQTQEPYEVIPIHLTSDTLYYGRMLCREGLNRLSHGLKTGEWPGVAKGFIEYSYPPSMITRFSELQATGELPHAW